MERQIGPYKLIKKIGTGGMGEVFQAHDHRLDRIVAIKCIRPGKEDTEENRERFEREAKATAKLNHPSIVHVYDTLPDGESHCIVMEYIEGPTLQSMTADGPLSPLSVIEIGKEIAEGLAAAHDKKILHRDLKTENIMVTPESRAKILDFGLAKPLISQELDSSLTGKGQLVGTSRAMSPEYVGGDEVDVRSDIFALGVLLYEISTGHSPFKAQNTLATLKQVIVHQQAPVSELNPEMPQELSDLVDQMLEKSPEDRPQTAREVAGELAKISGYYSSGTIDRSSSSPSHGYDTAGAEWSLSTTMVNPNLRRFWIAAVSVIAIALIGAYLLGRREGNSTGEPKESVRIVLGDFANLTGDRLLDNSLDIAFRTGLGQSRFIDILPNNQVEEALIRMQLEPDMVINRKVGIEICQREGAQAFVIGSIVKVGETYSLSAEITDPESQSNIYTTAGQVGTQGEILGALEKMVEDLRKNLGESIPALEKTSQPLDKVTTSNLEALKAYSLGVESRTGKREELMTQRKERIALLTQAIELDPEFAMAHVQLGVLYQSMGQTNQVTYHFDKARSYAHRLTTFEKMYVDGWLAMLHQNPAEMIRSWKLVTRIYPEYAQGHHNLSIIYWQYQNRFEDAIVEANTAVQHFEASRKARSALPLGYCQIAMEQYAEALVLFEEYGPVEGMVDVHVVQQRYAEALELFKKSEDISFQLLTHKAVFHLDRGEFSEAQTAARAFIAGDSADITNDFTARIILALATLQNGLSLSEVRAVIEESVEKARPILQDSDTVRFLTPVPFLATLGKISARISAVDQASSILDLIKAKAEDSKINLWISYVKMLEGEIHLARQRPSEALKSLEEAINSQETYQARESAAHILEKKGDIKRAIEENLWLHDRRGRAFAECFSMCAVRPGNIVAWAISMERLGRLYEADGRPEEAAKHHARFQDHWGGKPVMH